MTAKQQTIDKYEIIAEIGSGGFGTVYKAHDPGLDRYVALKVLQPRLVSDTNTLERFRQEAKQSARLKHPHIVTVYEVGESEGRYYIAMEYLQGQPLSQVIEQAGSLPPRRAAEIIRQVGEALDYAHATGVVHRDVKPSNIILDENDRATLTDFGIVKVLSEDAFVTTTGMVAGTPLYMAPEQITGEAVDARTDLYALGVVAYHLLTGQVPFSGTTPFAIQKGHVDKSPPDPREHNPALGEYITQVLLTALAKAPDARYQNGADLAAALEEAAQKEQDDYWLGMYNAAQDLTQQRQFSAALEKWQVLEKARPGYRDVDECIKFVEQQLTLGEQYLRVAETLAQAQAEAAEILEKDAAYPDDRLVFQRLGFSKSVVASPDQNPDPVLHRQMIPLLIALITLAALVISFVFILSTPSPEVLLRYSVYFSPAEINPYLAGFVVGIALVFWLANLASLVYKSKEIAPPTHYPTQFVISLGTLLALSLAFVFSVSAPSLEVQRSYGVYFYPVSISPYFVGVFLGLTLVVWVVKLVRLSLQYAAIRKS